MSSIIIINSVLRHHRKNGRYTEGIGCVDWAAYIFLFLIFVGFPIATAILLLLGYFD